MLVERWKLSRIFNLKDRKAKYSDPGNDLTSVLTIGKIPNRNRTCVKKLQECDLESSFERLEDHSLQGSTVNLNTVGPGNAIGNSTCK
ncbi:hypothetical protein V2A60_006703 [Cordyceps javanica]